MESLVKQIEQVQADLNNISREFEEVVNRLAKLDDSIERLKEDAMDADLKIADDDDGMIDDFCYQHRGIIRRDADFDTNIDYTSVDKGVEIEVQCSISNDGELLEDVARKFIEFLRERRAAK